MSEAVFSSEELERYARHLVLPEVGGAGQQKLKRARVLVVGAGGLGAPALSYLAAAGVGHLTIVDDDVVSLSNLQRQIIHATQNVGQPKTTSAAKAINALNPHVEVVAIDQRITPENGLAMIAQQTLVIDGSDNFATRYAMADVCERAEVPLLTSAVNRFDGSLTLLKPWQQDAQGALAPRYRDLFPSPPEDGAVPTCAEAGVLGAMTGVMGTLLALEAIKEICGIGSTLVGKLLMVDGLSLRFQTIAYKRVEGA